jgi:hypothetical protein
VVGGLAMAATHDTLLDLVALAYEAALDPDLWPEVAAGASRAFEGPHVVLGFAALTPKPQSRCATGSFLIPISSGCSSTRNSCARSPCGTRRS